MVAEPIAIAALFGGALGEWVHARRVHRVRHLAFGRTGQAPRWTRVTPFARVLGLSAFLWGTATLYEADDIARVDAAGDVQRLVVALDVSPSMDLRDAGPVGQQTRRERAAEVLRESIDSVRRTCRISLVAFWHDARPVVVDTVDRDILDNVFAGLPLTQAFDAKNRTTSVGAGLRGAFSIAKAWPANSTTVILVTDGDSQEADRIDVPPPAIGQVLVLGVGSLHGRKIANHESAQRPAFLRSAAERLGRGAYHNCNDAPAPLLPHLVSDMARTRDMRAWRFVLALLALAIGATLVAAAACALTLFGGRRPVPPKTPPDARARPVVATRLDRSEPLEVGS